MAAGNLLLDLSGCGSKACNGGGGTNAALMMQVQVPAGVSPGQMLQVASPSGQMMQVAVPAGVSAGQMIQIQVPAGGGGGVGGGYQLNQAVAVPDGPRMLMLRDLGDDEACAIIEAPTRSVALEFPS